ncbi:Cytochrome P450 [Mycolicibacterium neoaurum]|uniref:Steroid C26-monooxygenase n=1 Tax=Mycolicibacterium neoaurum TaxID=1795 RepID=A0AAV2WL48_MYCNE|nr:cytochrome P450 [Mycolicibacterium neoaurum]TLH61601.1 cytochrome P450 [Mycolicibacterium neoaurum]CDQ44498.1 cytochrome P450 [Mycolicibacterium neoaurum]SDE00104.1 Cytochrome P450 [Mycolicibacterium neoaurum]
MTSVSTPQVLLGRALDPANRVDPYPVYRQLREYGPLQIPEISLTVLSSYAHCDAVLRHPAAASDRMKSAIAQRQIAAGEQPRPFGLAGLVDKRRTPAFLFLDPPDHTRLRKLVAKAFAPRVINQLRQEIVSTVDSLLDTAQERGEFDAVTGLAYPVAVAVICRLLGVPVEDEPKFGIASTLLAQTVDPFLSATGEVPEGFTDRIEAGKWLRRYFRDLISARRRNPGDDLISALIAVEESGDQLSEDEIISTCNLLLIAGHESTVSMMATAVLAMLRDKQQWAALGKDPKRALRVIEETLRFDPAAQLLGRVAAEDITIGDLHIPKGDTMIVLLAAAHRDPAANANPDVFDPDRAVIRHLGFGHGAHFCLGAPLVRLEASIVLSAVTKRFPNAELGGEPAYKPNVTLRGMLSLPVTV